MGPSPQDINFKAKSMKKDTWDPKKALEEQTAYFAEKKAAKKAVAEDQADKMAANINVEGTKRLLTKDDEDTLLSDIDTGGAGLPKKLNFPKTPGKYTRESHDPALEEKYGVVGNDENSNEVQSGTRGV